MELPACRLLLGRVLGQSHEHRQQWQQTLPNCHPQASGSLFLRLPGGREGKGRGRQHVKLTVHHHHCPAYP